jgi:hypothetical protein
MQNNLKSHQHQYYSTPFLVNQWAKLFHISCETVIKGWTHPMITSQDETSSLKPEAGWINAEDNDTLENSNALNVIFNGVDKNMFRLINTCIEAKEA